MTTLVITPDFDDKVLVATGKICVGEKVDVTIVGVTEAQSADLRLRFRYDGNTVAVYPTAESDVWTYAGTSASATIDLNTDVFRALYEGFEDRDKLACVLIVDNPDDQNMYSSAKIQVGNWPVEAGADVPYSLSTYHDDVAQLQADVSDLEAASTATDALVASHNHQGGASQVLAHNDLTGIGTRTHDEIEVSLTAIEASQGTIQIEATGLRNDLNSIKTLCVSVKAMPIVKATEREARFAALVQGLIDILT
jgi:hypothetical protein